VDDSLSASTSAVVSVAETMQSEIQSNEPIPEIVEVPEVFEAIEDDECNDPAETVSIGSDTPSTVGETARSLLRSNDSDSVRNFL